MRYRDIYVNGNENAKENMYVCILMHKPLFYIWFKKQLWSLIKTLL